MADIVRQIEAIAKRRKLMLQVDVTHENRTVPCAPWLKAQVADAVAAEGYTVFELPSGAGHDGMAMIDLADVAMLFVRCRGGISHHPDEHVELADADAGARVLLRLIENFRPRSTAADPVLTRHHVHQFLAVERASRSVAVEIVFRAAPAIGASAQT